MNHAAVKLAIKDMTWEQSVAFLKQAGMPEDQITDYLHWINRPPVEVPKKNQDVPFTETPFWKKLQERINKVASEAPAPDPEPVQEVNLFERDVMHNRHLMGGSSLYDGASFHNPKLKETEAFRWFRNEYGPSGLSFALIVGGTGSGKTWGALAYVNSIAKVDYQSGRIEYSNAAYVHAYKLALMLQDPKGNRAELETITRKGILLLDDLGTEPLGYRGSDFIAHFEFLLNERHKFQRKTIMTSNTTAEGFKELYGERIVSRFNEIGMFKETKDPDLRQQSV